MEWNKHAFEDLVIDPDSKLLIQALVRNKIELDKGIDFIEGKGTGLVVLLHGFVTLRMCTAPTSD